MFLLLIIQAHIYPFCPINEIVNRPTRFRLSALNATAKVLNLLNLTHSALKVILFVFKSLLRTGYYSIISKMSEVVMIPKPRKDAIQVSSYSPISLLIFFNNKHNIPDVIISEIIIKLSNKYTEKLNYKVLLYKAVLQSIWLHGIQLWETAEIITFSEIAISPQFERT